MAKTECEVCEMGDSQVEHKKHKTNSTNGTEACHATFQFDLPRLLPDCPDPEEGNDCPNIDIRLVLELEPETANVSGAVLILEPPAMAYSEGGARLYQTLLTTPHGSSDSIFTTPRSGAASSRR